MLLLVTLASLSWEALSWEVDRPVQSSQSGELLRSSSEVPAVRQPEGAGARQHPCTAISIEESLDVQLLPSGRTAVQFPSQARPSQAWDRACYTRQPPQVAFAFAWDLPLNTSCVPGASSALAALAQQIGALHATVDLQRGSWVLPARARTCTPLERLWPNLTTACAPSAPTPGARSPRRTPRLVHTCWQGSRRACPGPAWCSAGAAWRTAWGPC